MNDAQYHGQIETGTALTDIFHPGPISLISPVTNTMRGLHQMYKEDWRQEAIALLTASNFKSAVEIIHEHGLTGFGHLARGLVSSPYELYLYLEVHRSQNIPIADDDLGAMFAACIEYAPGNVVDADNTIFAQASLQHLIDYKGDRELEIKLLPKRYRINDLLYTYIQGQGVRDRYYEMPNLPYTYPDIVLMRQNHQHVDYRDIYHILLYGSAIHLQSLVVYWDLWHDPAMMDAGRDFFGLNADTDIMDQINQLTTLRQGIIDH